MLELPECFAISKQLRHEIEGKEIEDSRFHSWPHKFTFYYGDYMLYPSMLNNARVDVVNQIGGNVELELGNVRMVLGDGLNLRYHKAGETLPEKHQLHLLFRDGSSLTGSTQMYSVINVFFDGENDSHYYRFSKEKPSPLTDDFDREYFSKMMEETKQNLSAKAFLATEQRIPGLGNGVLQDILFKSGIHPKTRLMKLDEDMRDKLYKSVKTVLKEMADKGGRDVEKDLYGNSGGYRTILSKNTLKEPCPVCGSWITKQAYLGGNIYYCEKCQPLL